MNIRSKEHANEFGVFVQKLCREMFRDYNTMQNFGFTVEHHDDGTDEYHTVSFEWCAVDVGFPIVRTGITGDKQVPGYHTWTSVWRPSCSRMEPDDYDLNTLSETESFNRAVNVVIDQFVSWRLRMLADNHYAKELINA